MAEELKIEGERPKRFRVSCEKSLSAESFDTAKKALAKVGEHRRIFGDAVKVTVCDGREEISIARLRDIASRE